MISNKEKETIKWKYFEKRKEAGGTETKGVKNDEERDVSEVKRDSRCYWTEKWLNVAVRRQMTLEYIDNEFIFHFNSGENTSTGYSRT